MTETPPPPPPDLPEPPTNAVATGSNAKPAGFRKLNKSDALPPRIILNAVEGFGKTTIASQIPNVAIVQAAGETGYETLHSAGLVPTVDVATVTTWEELLATVDSLIDTDTGHEAVAFDALGGFERLCHKSVCDSEYEGDWGEQGFEGFKRGYGTAVTPWLSFLARLDRLRRRRKITILLLSHTMVKLHSNPVGPDYDRYISDVHPKTWGPTAKWADCVLFGTFHQTVKGGKVTDKRNVKGKGMGKDMRVIHTTRRDAWDAKNRYGMSGSLDIPNDHTKGWDIIQQAIKGA